MEMSDCWEQRETQETPQDERDMNCIKKGSTSLIVILSFSLPTRSRLEILHHSLHRIRGPIYSGPRV